jgi:hypothetical protein
LYLVPLIMMTSASVDAPGAPAVFVSDGTVMANPAPPDATLAVAAPDPSARAYCLVAVALGPIAIALKFVAQALEPMAMEFVFEAVTDADDPMAIVLVAKADAKTPSATPDPAEYASYPTDVADVPVAAGVPALACDPRTVHCVYVDVPVC